MFYMLKVFHCEWIDWLITFILKQTGSRHSPQNTNLYDEDNEGTQYFICLHGNEWCVQGTTIPRCRTTLEMWKPEI